jgi:hypothetical protein
MYLLFQRMIWHKVYLPYEQHHHLHLHHEHHHTFTMNINTHPSNITFIGESCELQDGDFIELLIGLHRYKIVDETTSSSPSPSTSQQAKATSITTQSTPLLTTATSPTNGDNDAIREPSAKRMKLDQSAIDDTMDIQQDKMHIDTQKEEKEATPQTQMSQIVPPSPPVQGLEQEQVAHTSSLEKITQPHPTSQPEIQLTQPAQPAQPATQPTPAQPTPTAQSAQTIPTVQPTQTAQPGQTIAQPPPSMQLAQTTTMTQSVIPTVQLAAQPKQPTTEQPTAQPTSTVTQTSSHKTEMKQEKSEREKEVINLVETPQPTTSAEPIVISDDDGFLSFPS